MYKITRDKHLFLQQKEAESDDEEPEEDWKVSYKREIEKENFGFQEVKVLQGNIGYINIRNFHLPEFAGKAAVHTMNFIANTDALIIDLSRNGGGFPAMTSLITSYLVGPEPIT
jgi:retinol-binding protein 3